MYKTLHLTTVCSWWFLTINVPVVYMGRYEVVLRGAIHNEGHFLGGGGPKNRDFFGPLNGTSAASAIWAQKSRVIRRV
jgi:hypothetical protein